jgi:hypothetical protein
VKSAALHLLLAVVLLVAGPIRVLCYDSCASEAAAMQLSTDMRACHETHDDAPASPHPFDNECPHGNTAPAGSLSNIQQRVDTSGKVNLVSNAALVPNDVEALTPSPSPTLGHFLLALPTLRRIPQPLRI